MTDSQITPEDIAEVKQAILDSVERGEIPRTVTEFADIMDHVDATEFLLDFMDDEDDYTAAEDIRNELNAWIAAGGLL